MKKKQWSLIQAAIAKDRPEEVRTVCEEAGTSVVSARSPFQENLMQVAYHQNAVECVTAWMNEPWDWAHKDFRGHTVLVDAIGAGSHTWIEVLKKTGWPQKSHDDWKPIHEAFFTQEDESIALEGLDRGWDPLNWVGKHDQTAVHLAAERNWHVWLETYTQLAPSGACWASLNYWQNTPLMAGCRAGSEEAVKVLLKHCPPKELILSTRENRNNQTAVEMAIWKKKFGLVDVLLESFGQTSVTPLSYKHGVPKYAWNIAVATKTKEGLAWATKQRQWPKKLWPWQKSLALWVDDPVVLEEIRKKHPRKKWSATWSEPKTMWDLERGRSTFHEDIAPGKFSGAHWALVHGTWNSCQWWMKQKSPWTTSPFARLKHVKKERLEKLKGLLEDSPGQWVASNRKLKEKGDLASLAHKLTLEELDLLSSKVCWSTEEWLVGWFMAMSEGSVKQSRWFNERLPEKARLQIHKECSSGSNTMWFLLFKGLTQEKLNMMGESAPWDMWGSGFKQPEMQAQSLTNVADMWVRHANAHPRATKEWWDKVGGLPTPLCVEILTRGLKHCKPGVTSFMEKVLLQTEFFKEKGSYKKARPPWHEWLIRGDSKLLEYYSQRGWFDESHAINRKKNGWCSGGLSHPRQSRIAWGLWASDSGKKGLKPANAIANWLNEITPFQWGSVRLNKTEFETLHKKVRFEKEHWRWFLNHKDVWSLSDAPKRPLELLWSGPGFLGDTQIHQRLIKTLDASLWTKTPKGNSLGKVWLGKQFELPPRKFKILEGEPKEAVNEVWLELPHLDHPWALAFDSVMKSYRHYRSPVEEKYWDLLRKQLAHTASWANVPGILPQFVNYLVEKSRKSTPCASPQEAELTGILLKAWASELAKASIGCALDNYTKIPRVNVPVWYVFASCLPKAREKFWKLFDKHGADWNEKDSEGNDFVNYALEVVEDQIKNPYRMGGYHPNTNPEEVNMASLFAGNDMWNLWLSMGGCAPLSPVENSMAVRLSKWGEWRKWWERRQLSEKHATIIESSSLLSDAL